LVYYIIGYRKKIVYSNLKLVFPEKSENEIKQIQKKFYKHMCDMFLEMIKSISISENQINKRFIVKNPEELQRLESLGKSMITFYGHYASYEWSVAVGGHISHKGYGVYKPIKNKYFDALVKRIRSKYNVSFISTKQTVSTVVKNEAEGIKSMVGFLSDQSPKNWKRSYWSEFMSIKVPCFTGGEQLAKKLDLSATYLKINKVKRGFYEAEFIPLADKSKSFDDFDITDKFLRELEKQIREAPEYYLWTHKRWKHKDKYNFIKK